MSLHKGFIRGRRRRDRDRTPFTAASPGPPTSKTVAPERAPVPEEDARLTDFATAEDADQDPQEDDPGETPSDDGGPSGDGDPPDGDPPDDDREPPGDGGPPDDDPEPAVPTSSWRPGGVCDACGDPAERRWRDGEAFVCPGCKEW